MHCFHTNWTQLKEILSVTRPRAQFSKLRLRVPLAVDLPNDQSFSLGGSKPKAGADHVEEPAGYQGEWVTLVHRSAITKKPIQYKRRGRPVFETRDEAVAEARRAIKAGERWQRRPIGGKCL